MSLYSMLHILPIFHDKRKELREFYFSMTLNTFAYNLIAIFVPVYLLQIGYNLPEIIFFFFLISFYFVIFAYLGAKITSKIGIKHSILISAPFLILFVLGLGFLEHYPVLFFILPLFKAWRMILLNYSYHLHFLINSSTRSRGKQLSLLGVFLTLSSALAPLISGFLIFYYSFNLTFILGAILLLLSTTPMFFSKEEYQKTNFSGKELFKNFLSKKRRRMILSFTGHAVEVIIGVAIWPVFLIIILANTKKMGMVITLSMLITVFSYYLIGKITDRYDKSRILKVTTILYFLGWFGRIFANNVFKVFAIDSFKGLIDKLHHVPLDTYSYELASKKGFEFIVFRELVYNMARVIFMPILILIFIIDFYPFAISFLLASLFSLLYIFIIENKKSFFK